MAPEVFRHEPYNTKVSTDCSSGLLPATTAHRRRAQLRRLENGRVTCRRKQSAIFLVTSICKPLQGQPEGLLISPAICTCRWMCMPSP